MTSCRRVRALLPLGVGRDLPPRVQRRFDEHVRSCLPCARVWKEWREALAPIGRAAEEATVVPAALEDEVLAAVRASEARGAADPLRRPVGRRQVGVLAAALVVAATAAFFGGPWSDRPAVRGARPWPGEAGRFDLAPTSITLPGGGSGALPVGSPLAGPEPSRPRERRDGLARRPVRRLLPLAPARRPFVVSDDF